MPSYTLRINGRARTVACEPGKLLLAVLRDDFGLTGAKYGCGEGQCGACTVLVDGAAAHSCTLPMKAAAGREIVTIEGLARDGALSPVQQAFLDKSAFQCGYCTPGMIVGATALLAKQPDPEPEAIAEGLEGHICRCGSYPRIIEAVRAAAEAQRRGK